LLAPTLDILRTLVSQYNVSVVLSSATQPAFGHISGIKAREIVSDFPRHFTKLARVNYSRQPGKIAWPELAQAIQQRDRIMVVLNSRKDALELLNELGDTDHVLHLSTLLCGLHRKAVLRLVRQRLKNGLPIRLISTQVVEAGVDLDFPEVWRALGPLDRIVQAAGRCNREGKMTTRGTVVIFELAQGRMPCGTYRAGFGLAEFLLNQNDTEKLHDPALYEDYFRRLYADRNLDEHHIQTYRESLDFPQVACRYRLILGETIAVAVDYQRGLKRLEAWRAYPSQKSWRQVQPFLVNIYRHEGDRLRDWLEPVSEGLYRWLGHYDRIKGLSEAAYDPADLII
jgi:CRISPR-associated endonuclease/helicase Cas3